MFVCMFCFIVIIFSPKLGGGILTCVFVGERKKSKNFLGLFVGSPQKLPRGFVPPPPPPNAVEIAYQNSLLLVISLMYHIPNKHL